MVNEDNKLLFQDLSARLQYGVKARVFGWDEEKGEVEVSLKIYSINTDGYVYFETNDYDVNYLPIEDVRPYLRPMSSMTEEEKEELFNLCTMSDSSVNTNWESFGVRIVDTHPRYVDQYYTDYSAIDWLNKKMFDFRGLIPKNQAISTEMFNPYDN